MEKRTFYLGVSRIQAYGRVRASLGRAMCVRAWAETLLYRTKILGLKWLVSGRSHVPSMAVVMFGRGGEGAGEQEGDERMHVDA